MPPKFVYQEDRNVLTYVYLHKTAKKCLEDARSQETNRLYAKIASLVFSAFTMEAYLNHLGALRIRHWPEIDRIPIESKLRVVSMELGIKVDYGKRPAQTLREVLKFRNWMAHGRTEKVTVQQPVDDPDFDPKREFAQAAWESFCTLDEATRAFDDVSALIRQLHKAAGFDVDPFQSFGKGSMSVTLEEE